MATNHFQDSWCGHWQGVTIDTCSDKAFEKPADSNEWRPERRPERYKVVRQSSTEWHSCTAVLKQGEPGARTCAANRLHVYLGGSSDTTSSNSAANVEQRAQPMLCQRALQAASKLDALATPSHVTEPTGKSYGQECAGRNNRIRVVFCSIPHLLSQLEDMCFKKKAGKTLSGNKQVQQKRQRFSS